MLVRHLMVGVVVGAEAALATGLMGFSVWAMIGFCVLGANLGLLLSVLVALLPWRRAAGQDALGPAITPMQGTPAE